MGFDVFVVHGFHSSAADFCRETPKTPIARTRPFFDKNGRAKDARTFRGITKETTGTLP